MLSFLTKRQSEILRMSVRGLSHREIAKTLGTTRENVTIILKRAHENIEKARKTLEEYEEITAMEITLLPQLEESMIPGKIYDAADKQGIKVRMKTLDLLEKVRLFNAQNGKNPSKALLQSNGKVEFK